MVTIDQKLADLDKRALEIEEERALLKAQLVAAVNRGRAISDVFHPATVKLSCGCSPERAARCKQRGYHVERTGMYTEQERDNKQCHIFMHELDLLELVHRIVEARFLNSEIREEQPTRKALLNALRTYSMHASERDRPVFEQAIIAMEDSNPPVGIKVG